MTSVASEVEERSALRRFLLPGLFVAGLFWVLFSTIPENTGTPVPPPALSADIAGEALGTTYTVKVIAPPNKTVETAKVRTGIEEALVRVDALMSTWRDDSEISTLNSAPAGVANPIAEETAEVLAVAAQVYTASEGAFDITVGPLVDLWGFGPGGEQSEPNDAAIAAAKQKIGQHQMSVDQSARTFTKLIEGLEIDLSAIAKGYAADVVADAVRDAGYDRYMVEVGGEIVTRGHNAQSKRWQLAIERPMSDGTRVIQSVVSLSGKGMATSGDYRRFRMEDGRRLSHTIDPRTGSPVAHDLASVTVIADTAVEADAYATALLVEGPDAGMALAERERIAAYFLVRQADGVFDERRSTAWSVAGYHGDEGAE